MPTQFHDSRSILLTGETLGTAKSRKSAGDSSSAPCKSRKRGGVPSGPMKQLTDAQVKRAIEYARTAYNPPEAALLKVLLTVETGARACEIARLRMTNVTDAEGNIADVVSFPAGVAKKGRARQVTMTPLLRQALAAYRERFPGIDHLATARRSGEAQKAPSVKAWFYNFYHRLHLKHCGSHSGRKTFITNAAKMAPSLGMTLRDVQELAGHARLTTTQAYIGLSPNHDKLVAAISAGRLFDDREGGR